MRGVIVTGMAGALALAGTAVAGERVAFARQLDGDPAAERVVLQTRACDGGATCRRVAVRDGGRTVPVSTWTMTGYGYGATAAARPVRLMAGGASQLLIREDTVRGTGSSPAEITVVRWDGRRGRVMLRLSKTSRRMPPGFAYVAGIDARVLSGPRLLLTREALNRADDPTCCSSGVRVRTWRARGDRLIVVSSRVRRR